MSTIDGKPYQDPRGINLKGSARGTGLLRWEPPVAGSSAQNWASNPFSTNDYGLYINSSGQLVFSSTGSTTILGAGGGGGGVPTWEQIFNADATFSKTTVWTINNSSGDNEVLKLTNTGAGSGNVLVIDNGGTGLDIIGTADWQVAKTGAASFLSVTTATVNSASTLTLSADGAGLITIGANSNTVTIAKATTFSSTVTVTDGATVLGSTSNTAEVLQITNNTITTFGAGVVGGVTVIRSTSLTTGNLLQLQLAEGTLTTGNYITLWDTTGSTVVFEVGKAGATIIAGVGGSTVLTVTAGDMVMSDGSLTITDADNAATVSVTNNTATTIGAAASGGVATLISTSLTTGALLNLQLTEGTLNGGWYIRAWDATAGAGVFSVGEDGATVIAGVGGSTVLTITAGDAVMSDGSLAITDADNAETVTVINNTATTIGAAASAGVVQIESTSLTTGAALNVQLTEGTLNGGFYYSAWDATAGARVWSVGEDGATVIAGVAAGTTALTLTAGDAVLTSGHLVLTAGNATLTSGNLTLTSGTLTMTSGSATLTAGNLILTAGTIITTPQAIVNANTAISVTHGVTTIANNAASTHTLADGAAGQKKTIVCTVYTDDAVITPANLANGTTITLNAVGDACDLVFLGTEWWVTNLYGTAALA